jgi:hypothetical protein
MTRCIRFGFVLTLLALGSFGVAQEPEHVIVRPDDVPWGPASPKLPAGAQFARITGDPSKPGEPYVFRAKLPDGYRVPPHWHPMDEHVTVIQGVFRLGFGTTFDAGAIRELPPGSYAMLPKNAPHYNVMKGETILQFHGIGPYDVTYVNAAAEPSTRERVLR